MAGILTACLAAICYSLSYVFLHKGQSQWKLPDEGLFPILCIGGLTLGAATVYKLTVLNHDAVMAAPANQWVGFGFCVGSGLLGTLLGRLALYGSIRRIGATRGVIIKTLETIVTLFLAIQILRERPEATDILGIVLLLVGVGLLLLDQSLQRKYRAFLHAGILLGLCAVLFEGAGHFFRKLGMMWSVNPVVGAGLDMMAALLGYVLIMSFRGKMKSIFLYYARTYQPHLWSAGFLSALGVLFFFVSASSAPLSTVAVIVGMQPILVAALSAILSRDLEQLTWMTFVYAALAAAGVMLLK